MVLVFIILLNKTVLVWGDDNCKAASGDGEGYYQCFECKKRWILREIEPEDTKETV